MTFGQRIKDLREDYEPKLSQQELAQYVNTSQRKISRLETGDTEPSLADIVAICKFYNVSADYLLGLPRDMPYPKRQGQQGHSPSPR